MTPEKLQRKFWRKSTAAAVAILATVGMATVGKEIVNDHHAHDGSAQFSPIPPFANNPVSASETQYIKQDFQEFLATWVRIQPSMQHISLDIILSGTTNCGSETIHSNDITGMEFCVAENKVVITRGGINLINELSVPFANTWRALNHTPADYRPEVEHQLLDLFIAHELGHGAQRAITGDIHSGNLHTELQADCYAGQAYRDNGLMPSSQETANLYALISPQDDPTHGTAAQRSASFETGLTGGSCT